MRTPRTSDTIVLKDLSYKVVGCCFKAHDSLGRYALEKQYANFLEELFTEQGLKFEREKLLSKTGADINKADFLVEGVLVLELKSKPFIEKTDYYQVRRYLEIADLKLGLIVNFRQKYLMPKRVLNSQCSHTFA